MVKLLLEHSANPNSANTIGRPALQEALSARDVQSVRLLLDSGADVNFRNFYFVCALRFVLIDKL
jgi:ankyrin repeat protein